MAHLKDRDRVGRNGEERRVAEREQAGMAEQQVGRKREQSEDHDLHQQRDPELACEDRHAERRNDKRDQERGTRSHR
jgi:hypothetical protein